MKILMISIYLTLNLGAYKCELYTYASVKAMEKLLITQAHLIDSITTSQKFVVEKERRLIKTYLDKLKKEHSLSQKYPEHYLGNPINSYTLIARLYGDLRDVEDILNKTRTYRRKSSLVYPTSEDVKGAQRGIILLQFMYGLATPELANGTLNCHFGRSKEKYIEYVSPMTTNDCLNLAKLNYHKIYRSRYIAWLEEAYKRYRTGTDQELCFLTEEHIVATIGKQYYSLAAWDKAIFWFEKHLQLNPTNAATANAKKYARRRYLADFGKPKTLLSDSRNIDIRPFDKEPQRTVMRLCRDDESTFIPRIASITCYYAHGPHPFLILAPIKAERLHRSPDITVFYDVINDKEIQVFKIYSEPMSRSKVVDPVTGDVEVNDARTCYRGILPADFPEGNAVKRRMLQLTGARSGAETFESMQVLNYGISGYYIPHWDYFDVDLSNKKQNLRQRIATALFYLSDVEQGGATIFTEVNVTVYPVKHAVLFWYNLDPWGYGDPDTTHSACPVLRGSKWVAVNWFTLMEQDLIEICPTRPK